MPEIVDQPKPVLENVPPIPPVTPVQRKESNFGPLLIVFVVVAMAGLLVYFFLLSRTAQAPSSELAAPTPSPVVLEQPTAAPSEGTPSAVFPTLGAGASADDIIKDINNTNLGSDDADFIDLGKDASGL